MGWDARPAPLGIVERQGHNVCEIAVINPDEIQLARRCEFPAGRKALEAKLEWIGAAVDLAVEENVTGFDAQAVGGIEAAFNQAVAAASRQKRIPQALALGARHQQLV